MDLNQSASRRSLSASFAVAHLEKSALSCGSRRPNPSKIDSTGGAGSFYRADIRDRQGKNAKQYKILRVFLTQDSPIGADKNLIGSSPFRLDASKPFRLAPKAIKLFDPFGQRFYVILHFDQRSFSNTPVHIREHTQNIVIGV